MSAPKRSKIVFLFFFETKQPNTNPTTLEDTTNTIEDTEQEARLCDTLDAVHNGFHLLAALLKCSHLGVKRLVVGSELGLVLVELSEIFLVLRAFGGKGSLLLLNFLAASSKPVFGFTLVLLQKVARRRMG
jgi:hypothetical protein